MMDPYDSAERSSSFASPGRIAVLGPHIVDVLGRPVSHIPSGQGGAVLDEIRMTVAGTGGGAAVDLAKLGWQVSSYAAIGSDALGTFLRAQLESLGVATHGLIGKPGVQTSATILPIRPNGERPALHVPGATPRLAPADIDGVALATADAVLVGGPETTPDLLAPDGLELIGGLRASGSPVFVDLLHQTTKDTATLLSGLWPLVDWFMPNDEQLRGLTGLDDLADAAAALLDLGVGGVAVTTGADGALVVQRDAPPTVVPALPTTVVDTTGCGDSFNAGMITGIAAGCEPADAATLGCACGALVASGLGSDAGIVDLAGVLALVEKSAPEAARRLEDRFRSLGGNRTLAGAES